MDGYIFRFDAKKFRAIPRRYLGFLVASGHCCNELSILLPYIIFEHDLTNANEFEAAFIQTRKFTIDRVIISKIVEHGELCSKFFKTNKDPSDTQLLELKKAYEPIAAKIDSAKWARIMRNKVSFHYDPEQALSALDLLDDNHPLRLMAGTIKGLTLLEFAEEITSRPIFESAGSGDIGNGMDAAHVFIRDLVGEITRFQSQATIAMFKSFGIVSERIQTELRDQYCAAPGEVRMPISISSAYLESRRSKETEK
jgi:hypothetical protein